MEVQQLRRNQPPLCPLKGPSPPPNTPRGSVTDEVDLEPGVVFAMDPFPQFPQKTKLQTPRPPPISYPMLSSFPSSLDSDAFLYQEREKAISPDSSQGSEISYDQYHIPALALSPKVNGKTPNMLKLFTINFSVVLDDSLKLAQEIMPPLSPEAIIESNTSNTDIALPLNLDKLTEQVSILVFQFFYIYLTAYSPTKIKAQE